MNQTELNAALAAACDEAVPPLNEIKNLILAGADTNQLTKYGANIFASPFLEALYAAGENKTRLKSVVAQTKDLIQTMISHGWDIRRFGLSVMNQFIFSTYDRHTFDLYRFMLQYDLANDPAAYKSALDALGTEESYQRVCEENHRLENIFYAIYEMVKAKAQGRDYRSIGLYHDARNLKVDDILYFGDVNTLKTRGSHTEFNADIGFVCGDRLLILRKGINILFMNDRLSEAPKTHTPHLFGDGVIGSRIRNITFRHRSIRKGNTFYGQPTITLHLDSGKKLRFTHNFGELPGKECQSRFWAE